MTHVGEISDRVFLRQMSFHTSGPSYAQELSDQRKRNEWVDNRTEEIVNDDDYFPDLIQYILETSSGINALLHVKKAKFGDLLGASAHFHEYLTKTARMIAESEAKVRFGE